MLLAYHVVFVLGVRHRDSTFIYLVMCSPRQAYQPSVAVQNYYATIDSISYAVHPGSYLFYNWKLFLLFPFMLFSHCSISPASSPSSRHSLFSESESVSVFFVLVFNSLQKRESDFYLLSVFHVPTCCLLYVGTIMRA